MRLEGQASAGYFPTPTHLIPRIAQLLEIAQYAETATTYSRGDIHFMDPCAGKGEALEELSQILLQDQTSSKFYTIEMEKTRFEELKTKLHSFGFKHSSLHGDAFQVKFSKVSDYGSTYDGIGLLWLNPPYDFDRQHGRLEQKFLQRFTEALAIGGVLVFLVPFYALKASAAYLAQEYSNLHCFRFPGEDWDVYKQVVLIASKSEPLLAPDPSLERQILQWAADADSIPELPETSAPLLVVPRELNHYSGGLAVWNMVGVDLVDVLAKVKPWFSTDRSGKVQPIAGIIPDVDLDDLLTRRYPVAMPPRPAHIAAGIAAGIFNGSRIEPDSDPKLPPLLVKGVFDKEFRTIEEKLDKNGDVKGVVQVQQPKLITTVLDLHKRQYHTITPAIAPSNSGDIASMNTADLLANYGKSLMGVMLQQCPVMHDPKNSEHQICLPTLSRKLYWAQDQVVQGAIKLLGGLKAKRAQRAGKTAIVLGEIGSGKCLGLGTKVLRYDGTLVSVEDVQIGDLLMGPDSKPRTVLDSTRGQGKMYQVTPVTGDPWTCNEAHILTLVHTMSDDVFDIPLKTYIESKRLSKHLKKGNRTTHPVAEFKQFFPESGVDFPNQDPPLINPYFLGLWYGDGTKDLNSVGVTTLDAPIEACIYSMAAEFGLKVTSSIIRPTKKCPTYHITTGKFGGIPNPLLDLLRKVWGDGVRLPSSCLLGDRITRKAFLAGLLDSDGSYQNGGYDFTQKIKTWSEDVCFLARSLGFRATMCKSIKSCQTGAVGEYWRVCLSGDFSDLPVRLLRKMAQPRASIRKNRRSDLNSGVRRTKNVSRTGIKVQPIGTGEYAGFQLDGDGRFLLGDFTVTHNSSCALATAHALEFKRTLVICPPHLLQSWTDQIQAVTPWVKTVIIQDIQGVQDILSYDGEAPVIAVLSRETAKLGHSWASAHGVCPKCGASTPATDLAKKRVRCEAQTLRIQSVEAKLAFDMALTLLPVLPEAARIQQLLCSRNLKKYAKICEAREVKPTLQSLSTKIDNLVDRLLPKACEGDAAYLKALTYLLFADPNQERIVRAARALFLASMVDSSSYGLGTTIRASALIILLFLPQKSKVRNALIEELSALPLQTSYYGNIWDTWKKQVAARDRVHNDYWHSDLSFTEKSVVYNKLELGDAKAALEALGCISTTARLKWTAPCGEPLYQAIPEPRRYPIANYIAKRCPSLFDFLVLDEIQEFSAEFSAQSFAAHRLSGLGIPTMALTGSIMNGYAESLFTNFWALSPAFRDEFARDERQKFVNRYGYRKRFVEERDTETKEVMAFGSMTDRIEKSSRTIGNAPGVLPLFLLKHLLAISVTLHKSDLALDLPKCYETAIPVQASPALAASYQTLETALVAAIRRDRFKEDRSGKLWGALAELPAYLDRATSDVGNQEDGTYSVRYPESLNHEIVAIAAPFPANTILPKEEWMLNKLAEELAEGRNVMIFAWHVNLLPRLARLVEQRFGFKCPILNSDKVSTAKRENWINKEVIQKKHRVLIVNPVTVQTGLNNLVYFSTEIWMQNPGVNAITYRQANGRIDRIGQDLETRIFFPYYEGTTQSDLRELLMHKVAVSQSTDGLDNESALRAAGAGDGESFAGFAVGQRLYDLITAREA